MNIECGSDEHTRLKHTAWIAILMYPVGAIALNACLLFSGRRAILSGRATPLSKAIAFLHEE